MGYKAYGGGARMKVFLYSTESGQLIGILDANRLGQMRTGAASGVATKYLARADASVVGLIGAGFQARSQLEAIVAQRSITDVRVYSRTAERREAFARDMAAAPLSVTPVAAIEEAVRGADIVVTATSTREPVLAGALLEPGQHVNAIGANSLTRRELDEAAVARANVITVDSREQAAMECGDIVFAIDRGRAQWEQVHELAAVVAGYHPGRRSAAEITLFESQGLALEDVATAALVLAEARQRGLGVELPFT
jgi:ornithine cyclodeaminase/alanine dehydrogenase-like protein (mu-crystallin family)